MEPCGAAGADGFSAAGAFFDFLLFSGGPGAFLFCAAILPRESRREGKGLSVLPHEVRRCFREHGAPRTTNPSPWSPPFPSLRI